MISCEKIVSYFMRKVHLILSKKILWSSYDLLWKDCSIPENPPRDNILWKDSVIFYEKNSLIFCERMLKSSVGSFSDLLWKDPPIFREKIVGSSIKKNPLILCEKFLWLIWSSKRILSDVPREYLTILWFFYKKSSSRISPNLLWDLMWEDYVFPGKIP